MAETRIYDINKIKGFVDEIEIVNTGMKLIAEVATMHILAGALKIIKNTWGLTFDSLEYLEDIKQAPFQIYHKEMDGQVRRVILPADPGTMFVYMYGAHAADTIHFAGANLPDRKKSPNGDRSTAVLFDKDGPETLALRIIHEYIHALGLPADDLDKHTLRFLPAFQFIKYHILKLLKLAPEHIHTFQFRYYTYLFKQRTAGAL